MLSRNPERSVKKRMAIEAMSVKVPYERNSLPGASTFSSMVRIVTSRHPGEQFAQTVRTSSRPQAFGRVGEIGRSYEPFHAVTWATGTRCWSPPSVIIRVSTHPLMSPIEATEHAGLRAGKSSRDTKGACLKILPKPLRREILPSFTWVVRESPPLATSRHRRGTRDVRVPPCGAGIKDPSRITIPETPLLFANNLNKAH